MQGTEQMKKRMAEMIDLTLYAWSILFLSRNHFCIYQPLQHYRISDNPQIRPR